MTLGRSRLVAVFIVICTGMIWFCKPGFAAVEIVYFNWFSEAERTAVEKEIIDEFNRTHPGIKVVKQSTTWGEHWTKFLTLTAAGLSPDVVCIDRAYALSAYSQGMLLDLSPFIKRDRFDLSQFRPGAEFFTGETVGDGSVRSFPWAVGPRNLYYNRDMFEETGLQFPYKGWTVQEFITAAKRLTKDKNGDGNPEVFGLDGWIGYGEGFISIDGANVADVRSGKITLDDPRFVKNMQLLIDLNLKYKVRGGSFTAGTAAMTAVFEGIIPAWVRSGLHEKFNWGGTWFPRDSGPVITALGGNIMFIPKGSRHPQEAWEFLKFYYSDTAQKILARNFLYPGTKNGIRMVGELFKLPKPLVIKEVLGPSIDPGMIIVVPWWVPGVNEAHVKAMSTSEEVILGKKPLETWIKEFEKEIDVAAKQYVK